MTGQDGCDVAELPAVVDDGLAQVGPAALDVGTDPLGDGGSDLLVGGVGHVVHGGGNRPCSASRGPAWRWATEAPVAKRWVR